MTSEATPPRAGRSRVQMSQDEVETFLGGSLKVQVATVNQDGSPHLTTLFYVLYGGRLGFWTYARSQKVRNLERDPRITCLVEDGQDYLELRGVSLHGTAEIVRDAEAVRKVGVSVAERMAGGSDLGEPGAAEVDRQVPKRVAVLVTPVKVASWDHRKLSG